MISALNGTPGFVLAAFLVWLLLLNLASSAIEPPSQHGDSCAAAAAATGASSTEEADEQGLLHLDIRNRKLPSPPAPGGCLPHSALIVIDVQNDFVMPTGSLAGGGKEDILEPINKVIKGCKWRQVLYTADFHPHNHVSFNVNYPTTQETTPNGPFSIVELKYSNLTYDDGAKLCGAEYVKRYGAAGDVCNNFPDGAGRIYAPAYTIHQETYPPHCVQGTWGQKIVSDLHYDLDTDTTILKGYPGHIDSYSAIFDNLACKDETAEAVSEGSAKCLPTSKPYPKQTNVADILRSAGIKNVYVVGVCFDYCVKFTAIHSAFLGFKTHVIKDATKACIDFEHPHAVASEEAMIQSNVTITNMTAIGL